MANIQISQLPAAGPLTGTELVPIVQSGVTVQTTTQAIAASPNLTQTFLTVNQETTLPNSRSLAGNNGVTLVDGGAQAALTVQLTGAALQFQNAGAGIIAKTSTATVAPRTITSSGLGLSVTDGNGVSGDPTIALTGRAAAVAGLGGSSGIVALSGAGVTSVDILGTAGEIDVANGSGPSNPTISIADDAVLPGTGGVVVPKGTAAQQPVGISGQIRFNTDTQTFDGYSAGSWRQFSTAGGVTSFSAGGTGLTPSAPTNGVVTLGGTLNVSSGGTGANTLTGYLVGNGTSPFTAVATIPNAGLTYSSITINGVNVSLGGSATITASVPNALTVGTGLQLNSGSTFDGSAARTISIDSSVATLTGSQTLTNKTISGNNNTLSDIGNSSLTNSSVTYNGVAVSLGGSGTITANTTNSLTFDNSGSGSASPTVFNGSTAYTISYNSIGASPLAGSSSLTTVGTVTSGTWNATPIANNYLANSAVTIGTTAISLGASSLTLGGLTSVELTQNPTTALQVATKQYVDTLVSSGITYHTPVKYEVPGGNLNATYNQPGGPGVGVGATLTNAGTLAAFAPDGPTAAPGDRILIYNQTNQFENGVYTVTVVGDGSTPWVLTRATDADTYALKSTTGLGEGDAFFITSGNTGAGETYVCNTVGTITFGTTAITFAQVSASQVYSAGTGLTLSGTQFSITNTGVSAATYGSASSVPTIAVNAQGQITSASNTAIAINGNQITSGTVGSAYISGSYTGITGVGTLTAGTWNASTIDAAYGGTGLSSYAAGDLLYASGTTALSKLGIGTNGQILTSSGTAPQWTNGSSISVGTATNLAGGTAGALPYQTGAGATTFLSLGATDYILVAGATAPQYAAPSTLSVGSATNLTGGTTGSIVYQTSTGTTSYLTLGTTNYVLTAGGSAPQYVAQSTLSVGSATNATNASNVAIAVDSTNADYFINVVSTNTGNLPIKVATGLTANPSTGKITGGIAGGTF